MIQSKLSIGSRVIAAGSFPAAATLQTATDHAVHTTYCNNAILSSRLTEQRIGDYTLLKQKASCRQACDFEVRRTGAPALLMSLTRDGDLVRSRQEDRHWQSGDTCLTLIPYEDAVVNHCTADSSFELLNIVVPATAITRLAERFPAELEHFCHDFRRESPRCYNAPHTLAPPRLTQAFLAMERSLEMGNCAGKYAESLILDCLSMLINLSSRPCNADTPTNLVLKGKMHDARDIIASRYTDPPSLHELATMVGTNECTLKSAFKQTFGSTVFQYLFDLRMDIATQQLTTTQQSVVQIADMVGYDYLSHFCTAFRRKFGCSPTTYRQHHAPAANSH